MLRHPILVYEESWICEVQIERLGPIDGHIHILQLQYFCENMKHDLLIDYWGEVMVIFITIKSSSSEDIRDWLA